MFDAELEHRLRAPLSASALAQLARALATLRLAAQATDTTKA